MMRLLEEDISLLANVYGFTKVRIHNKEELEFFLYQVNRGITNGVYVSRNEDSRYQIRAASFEAMQRINEIERLDIFSEIEQGIIDCGTHPDDFLAHLTHVLQGEGDYF